MLFEKEQISVISFFYQIFQKDIELAGTLLLFEDKKIEMVGQVTYADIGKSLKIDSAGNNFYC